MSKMKNEEMNPKVGVICGSLARREKNKKQRNFINAIQDLLPWVEIQARF
jgi:hypothetical protein